MRGILASEEDRGARKQLQSVRDWVNNKLQESIEPRRKMTKDFNDGYHSGWSDAYIDMRLELAKREESL
jgi:hypothetical protein